MNAMDLFLTVAAVGIAILVGVITPTLLQFRRTIKKTEVFMDNLNQDLTPLLKSLSQTSMELQILTTNLNSKIKRTDRVLDTLQQTSSTVLRATDMIKSTISPAIAQVGGMTAGAKAVLAFFKALKKH